MILKVLLTVSSLAAAGPAPDVKKTPVPRVLEDLRARVARANEEEYEDILKNDLSPALATARLKTIYTRKADQEYLDAYIKKMADARKPVRMKAFERTKTEYDITAPNGRVLHVSSRGPRQPVINGPAVPMDSLKAALEVYARAYDGRYARHHGVFSLLTPREAIGRLGHGQSGARRSHDGHLAIGHEVGGVGYGEYAHRRNRSTREPLPVL